MNTENSILKTILYKFTIKVYCKENENLNNQKGA